MFRYFILILSGCMLCTAYSHAQTEDGTAIKQWLGTEIATLADTAMHGRGYVKNGRETASLYLQKRFAEMKLKPAGRKKTYTQPYTFPVNTFPGKMGLSINSKALVPGQDFIIDAASPSYNYDNLALRTIDMAKIPTNEAWDKMVATFRDGKTVYYLKNIDEGSKVLDIRKAKLAVNLPKGCYIIPEKDKLTWDVAQDNNDAVVFYVKENAMTADSGTVNVQVDAVLQPESENENIVGYIPGEVEDSFIAITAHYDHLGMMGDQTIFPGASDNASGTAMLLYLANYYSSHPEHYSVLFMAFSGEEPGLLGSKYYTRNPIVMQGRIKFLTNIDIMGDATDGITVVNATEYPDQFDLLQKINKEHNYLPQVKSRGKAANSDHYYFSEAGVPSFFMYSNGGKGYYHDIYDKANELSLQNVDGVARLIIDFVHQIR